MKRLSRRRALSSRSTTTRLVGIALLIPVLAGAQAARPPQALIDHQPSISTTKQTGTFGGQTVPYTATVEEHILKGPDSIPSAFLVTIAYVRDDVGDKSKRPVAFLFNGGPGASSSPLHFSGVGPRTGGRGGVSNNPYSILDATDLVFIDPVGTGFSRPYTTELGKQLYWNQNGDAASVVETIRRWLVKNNRMNSPRYLIGESYGTTRAATILKNHKDLPFDGVVLISGVAENRAFPAMSYARNIPAMAVAAWYHEKTPKAGRTAEGVWDEASKFVHDEYMPALSRKDTLSTAEKAKLADKLSSLIGLPASFILEKNLKLSAQDWLMNILKDRNLRVSNQDTRVTGPLVLSAEEAARSSPAEGLGGTRIGTAMQAPALIAGSPEAAAAAQDARPSALETYLKNDLQFKTLETYRSLNLDINGFFRPAGSGSSWEAAPGVAEGMNANPKMRMFWIQGYYDLNTPATGVLFSFEQAGLTGDRVSGMMAPGPHTVFATDESKQALSMALRKWIH